MKVFKLHLLYCALIVSLVPAARAAFTFNISPAVVSNTYNGYLTLTVTGLTNAAETVVVQKFLDANRNGLIDPGDTLWQQFNLTDGTNSHIGGVTNLNVPGDLDTIAGQITARLNFQGDSAQQVAGNYLIKISDPYGHTVTNTFAVTSFPWPQQFTGTVVSNGVPMPYAGVILFQQTQGSDFTSMGGTVANGSGVYTLPAPTGTYALLAFASNTVANLAAASSLILGNSLTLGTNLSVIPATTTISGTVQVAGNPSHGLPGLLVPVQTKTGLLSVCTSDTNGNYVAHVTADSWKVQTDSGGSAALGYVSPGNKTSISTTGGSVSGVPINLTLGTALFYGTVKDVFGNLLSGAVDVEASDFASSYQSDGFTDGNGNYVATAAGGLGSNDLWMVQIGNSSSFPNYLFSEPQGDLFGGTNLVAGQAVSANFGAIIATNQITGHVQTSAGSAIAGLGISAIWTTNGFTFYNYVDTDTNGNFTFQVGRGSWFIDVNAQFGNDGLDNLLGAGNFQAPPFTNLVITTSNATLNLIVGPCQGTQIFTTNLPNAQVGLLYFADFQGSTCLNIENWSVNDPQDFPPNFTLDNFGDLEGTPVTNGTYHFSVQLNDGNGNYANQSLTLVIGPASTVLQVETTSLPEATNGVFYSQLLFSTGGQPPVHWALAPASASLPPGLTLSTNGSLSGTPTTNGTFYFFVEVTDSTNATATQGLSLLVTNTTLPLAITTTTLPGASQNAHYTNTLAATGGQPPYSWSLAGGSAGLPFGISLATNGVISGTPISSGTAEFIVEVTDSTATWTYQVLSLTVSPSSLPQSIKLGLTAQPVAGACQFTFKAGANVVYTVQASTNLTTWADSQTFEFTNSAPSGETWTVTIPNPTGTAHRYYRVKVGQ